MSYADGIDLDLSGRRLAVGVAGVVVLVFVLWGLVDGGSIARDVLLIVTSQRFLASALRLSVPIAFAALGGIFAEKSGVINIGLEGLLIMSAFTAIYGADVTGSVTLGFLLGVLASTLFAGLFAVVCIRYRADQIIAGLAVWLIALGLAPFLSQVVYNGPNTAIISGSIPSAADLVGGIPVLGGLQAALAGIPFFGALFDASVTVYLMFLAVAASWYTLYRTRFGRWVRASGENPKALDTAGVNVTRVRYAAVLLSGFLSGMGGAALSLGISQFTGNSATMVNGKGFIAIVTYLFGNYNPVGAFLSTLLFAGLDALQSNLQNVGVGIPSSLVRTIPFVAVIIVLALVGRTRIPEAAGEPYESGEDH